MVTRVGRHYGIPLKGYHGVTQGDPLSPTIFNVDLDSIIRHWLAVVAATKEGREGLDLSTQDSEAYFNAKNGIDSTGDAAEGVRHPQRPLRPGWPQD